MQTGQSYLEERKILPATIQAHRLEFDDAPTAERVVERLGEDIVLAGQPLSQDSWTIALVSVFQRRRRNRLLDRPDISDAGQWPEISDAKRWQRCAIHYAGGLGDRGQGGRAINSN